MKKTRLLIFYLLIASFLASCASTGPSVSRAERKRKEDEFNAKFTQASQKLLPRVYRIGYKLVESHVPGHGSEAPKFEFIGVGVGDLKDYARAVYGIDKSVKGVLVLGLYPGSKAEGVDLKPGDVIEMVNGKKTKSLGSYFKRIRKAKGESVTMKIVRKGERLECTVPLEHVYYNAQFFLAPTPDLDAHSAFSKIGIGIGAIRYCRNDDELATIMGHELAHTTLKHSLKKMGVGLSTAIAYSAVAGIVDAFTFPGLGRLITDPAQEATEAAVSRRYEREADYFGMKHAFHAGYDVENGSKVFGRLATDAPSFTLLAYTFADHPKTSERALRLEKIVEEFKTQYPSKFPIERHPDWDVIVPVEAGETLEVALQKLLQEKKPEEKKSEDQRSEEKKSEEKKESTSQQQGQNRPVRVTSPVPVGAH